MTMKRTLPIIILCMLFAGCADGEITFPDFSVSSEEGVFQTLEITQQLPGSVTEEITADVNRGLKRVIKQKKNGSLTTVCSDSADLTEEDIADIVALLDAAELFSYSPDADCEEGEDADEVSISYRRQDGMFNEFTTSCELAAPVEDIIQALGAMADDLIPDCSADDATPQLTLIPIIRPRLLHPSLMNPPDGDDDDDDDD